MKKLILEKNPTKIFDEFTKVFANKNLFEVWQIIGEKTFNNSCYITRISEEKLSYWVAPKDPKNPFEFKEGYPVYFRQNEWEFVFINPMAEFSPQSVRFLFPSQISYYFHKRDPRTIFAGQVRKNVRLASQVKNFEKTVKLLDISRSGAAISIHQSGLFGLNKGDQISITSLAAIPLEPPLLADIVYITELDKHKSVLPLYRIGVKFERRLEQDQLGQIIA